MICSRHVQGFLCLSFSLQTSLLFWGFGQHLFAVADKTLLSLHLFSFHAVLIFIRLLYLCFLVISSLFDFTTSIRVINFIFFLLYILFVFLYFCYWLLYLQNSRKVFLFSRFLLKLLWLEQMFATAFNPGLTRMWERVVGITSKTDLSAFSCLLFYSL